MVARHNPRVRSRLACAFEPTQRPRLTYNDRRCLQADSRNCAKKRDSTAQVLVFLDLLLNLAFELFDLAVNFFKRLPVRLTNGFVASLLQAVLGPRLLLLEGLLCPRELLETAFSRRRRLPWLRLFSRSKASNERRVRRIGLCSLELTIRIPMNASRIDNAHAVSFLVKTSSNRLIRRLTPCIRRSLPGSLLDRGVNSKDVRVLPNRLRHSFLRWQPPHWTRPVPKRTSQRRFRETDSRSKWPVLLPCW